MDMTDIRDTGVLAQLLTAAQPDGLHLNTETYAREILAIDREEQGAIRLGIADITPLSEVLP